jgi:hypothetical protein
VAHVNFDAQITFQPDCGPDLGDRGMEVAAAGCACKIPTEFYGFAGDYRFWISMRENQFVETGNQDRPRRSVLREESEYTREISTTLCFRFHC